MLEERLEPIGRDKLDLFIDLITSDGKHLEAWGAFNVVTLVESLAARSEGERAGFLKEVAKARRKFLFQSQVELFNAYQEIEVVFNNLGIDIKDSSSILIKINADERVKMMNQLHRSLDEPQIGTN